MTDLDTTTLGDYLEALSARSATPGGGSLAALNAAQAFALTMMVAEFSAAKFRSRVEELGRRRDALLQAAEDDIAAFNHVMEHWKADHSREKAAALLRAAEVPKRIVELGIPLVDLLGQLRREGNRRLASDVAIAADLLRTALFASDLHIRINLAQLDEGSVPSFHRALVASGDAQSSLARIAAEVKKALPG